MVQFGANPATVPCRRRRLGCISARSAAGRRDHRHVRIRSVIGLVTVAVSLGVIGCTPAPTAAQGRALYVENGCGSCHGPDGHGDGMVASQLDPAPPDFRLGIFRSGRDVDAIARTIGTGLSTVPAVLRRPEHAGHHHSQGMPPYPHLSDDERRALALYVVSVHASSRP